MKVYLLNRVAFGEGSVALPTGEVFPTYESAKNALQKHVANLTAPLSNGEPQYSVINDDEQTTPVFALFRRFIHLQNGDQHSCFHNIYFTIYDGMLNE